MRANIRSISRKMMSAILSVVMLTGIVGATGLVAKAEGNPYEVDTVIAENDYTGAKNESDAWSDFRNYSGDLYPTKALDDNSNHALKYRPESYALGLAILGHDYKTYGVGVLENQPVRVEAGVKYQVDFKIYVNGTAGAELEIGLGVGAKPDYSVSAVDETNYKTYFRQYEKAVSFPVGTTFEANWNSYTGYITVPENADVTTDNLLFLYLKGGKEGSVYTDVYVDDVKVTALAPKNESEGPEQGNNQGGNQGQQEVDRVIAENDYTDAKNESNAWSDFRNYSGDLYPTKALDDTSNHVLKYHPESFALGLAILGHDYKTYGVGVLENQPVRVESGVTYQVDFKLFVNGTAGAELEIGLGVGAKPDYSAQPVDETNYKTYFSPLKKVVSFPIGTTFEASWNSYTGYITVPESADVTTDNLLFLYLKGGKEGSAYTDVYVDNVKVTALAPGNEPKDPEQGDNQGGGQGTANNQNGNQEQDTKPNVDRVVANNNYDGALKQEESRSEAFYNYSGDLSPVTAPDNRNNTALWYRQSWYGFGMVLLGHDYKTSKVVNRVHAEAGVTYKVEFSAYTKGKTGAALQIGLGYGADGFEGAINETNYKEYLSSIVELANFQTNTTLTEGWKDYKGYITIPKDADISAKDALYIYIKGGDKTANVYIDNVKVTALAPGNVPKTGDAMPIWGYLASVIVMGAVIINVSKRKKEMA